MTMGTGYSDGRFKFIFSAFTDVPFLSTFFTANNNSSFHIIPLAPLKNPRDSLFFPSWSRYTAHILDSDTHRDLHRQAQEVTILVPAWLAYMFYNTAV